MTSSVRPARNRGLVGYVPWVLRDYFTNQGPSTVVVVVLIAYMSFQTALQSPAGPLSLDSIPLEAARRIQRTLFTPLLFLGTFFATNGIIANDRKFNFYRFLFAKPINPLAYYGMVFAAYGLGFLLITCALLAVWDVLVRPMFPLEIFVMLPAMYIAYGGIGFLLSAAWRFDWISLVSVILIANVAWGMFGQSDHPLAVLLYLLPPTHKTGPLYELDFGQPFPWGPLLWLVGYGTVCFVLGLVVLRKRSMGTS
jgi:hypothetical protein